MEMLAIEHIVPRNTGYIRIVGKSISENPSHPSHGLIAKPRPRHSDKPKYPVGWPDARKGDILGGRGWAEGCRSGLSHGLGCSLTDNSNPKDQACQYTKDLTFMPKVGSTPTGIANTKDNSPAAASALGCCFVQVF